MEKRQIVERDHGRRIYASLQMQPLIQNGQYFVIGTKLQNGHTAWLFKNWHFNEIQKDFEKKKLTIFGKYYVTNI